MDGEFIERLKIPRYGEVLELVAEYMDWRLRTWPIWTNTGDARLVWDQEVGSSNLPAQTR